jgi:hypothetical protein
VEESRQERFVGHTLIVQAQEPDVGVPDVDMEPVIRWAEYSVAS